ncbi:MAG: pyridoxamine 5'-phosphate oxidase family protein [Pseudomonadales bacterium]|nr:pyridoxamine 5'-phosphate oxidase family protein [Pseudomonadales bacterium]
MGQQYSELSEKHITFISQQKIFFVGTATGDSRVNVSPKGMDSFKIIDDKCLVWLNVTGSGNETAAHVQVDPRMTIMFTAFEGSPMILRIYGTAEAIHQNDENWDELYSLFNPLPGARQIFKVSIEMVQTSCGMAVPYFDYSGERNQLKEWAEKKGNEGIREYWTNKNQESIDGIPTNILEKSI